MVFAGRGRGRPAGIAAGVVADAVFGDPRRGHPVALFGRGAAALERLTYATAGPPGRCTPPDCSSPSRCRGARRATRAGARGGWRATAAATFVALGGTSLGRTGDADGRPAGRRRHRRRPGALLPSLCGRDPAALDAAGLTRAALESVAENTSDAQVAPLLWAAVGGIPAVLVYRGANTLDAMIGNRSPRYARFGWAAARFDDARQLRRRLG